MKLDIKDDLEKLKEIPCDFQIAIYNHILLGTLGTAMELSKCPIYYVAASFIRSLSTPVHGQVTKVVGT